MDQQLEGQAHRLAASVSLSRPNSDSIDTSCLELTQSKLTLVAACKPIDPCPRLPKQRASIAVGLCGSTPGPVLNSYSHQFILTPHLTPRKALNGGRSRGNNRRLPRLSEPTIMALDLCAAHAVQSHVQCSRNEALPIII